MQSRVLAFAIDSVNDALLQNWMQAGRLPTLERLARRGQSFELIHQKQGRNVACWLPATTGRCAEKEGHWGEVFDSVNYQFHNQGRHEAEPTRPFYSGLAETRVAVFDLPAPLDANVNGIQVLDWSSERNSTRLDSDPPELFTELTERYGSDPKLTAGGAYRIPCAYDLPALLEFREKLVQSASGRCRIMHDLLNREAWDLFIGTFSETHSAGHCLWHLSQPHPLSGLREPSNPECPLLAVARGVDDAIGELVDQHAGAETHVVVLTVDDMRSSNRDVPGMVLLPELLYRWCFDGRRALTDSTQSNVPPLRTDYSRHWKYEVWDLRTEDGERDLESPNQQQAADDPLHWQPANWYRPAWPRMKAFALPGIADGLIRLNVAGRESHGIIEPKQFDTVCSALCELLEQLTDERTGQPMVSGIEQVRSDPFEICPQQSPADLIVCWNECSATDVMRSPEFGRIGPVPFFRTGGHSSSALPIRNRAIICGPDVTPGDGGTGRLEDVPATILSLLGHDVPETIDGQPLSLRAASTSE